MNKYLIWGLVKPCYRRLIDSNNRTQFVIWRKQKLIMVTCSSRRHQTSGIIIIMWHCHKQNVKGVTKRQQVHLKGCSNFQVRFRKMWICAHHVQFFELYGQIIAFSLKYQTSNWSIRNTNQHEMLNWYSCPRRWIVCIFFCQEIIELFYDSHVFNNCCMKTIVVIGCISI